MVTVYTKSACVQCSATIRKLDSLGVAYELVHLDSNPEALALVKEQYDALQAPVVVTPDTHWSGFQPDKLHELV